MTTATNFFSVAAYLYVLTNVSWTKEVEAMTLTKEFMTQHGLKGSPKLSKQLLSLGLSQQHVSAVMELAKPSTSTFKLWENGESPELAVRLQGNSTHFKTCQRVADPFDSTCWEGGAPQYCKILEDLEAYQKGFLGFVTVGNPIIQDGIGWTSRAKLRAIYNRNEVVAYILDRPYGDIEPLLEAAQSISLEKGLPIFGSTQYYTGKTVQYLKREWVIPSQKYGYQDSQDLSGVVILGGESLLKRIYQSREKVEGVYRTAVTKGVFNPQKGKMIEKPLPSSRSLERAYKYWGLDPRDVHEKEGYLVWSEETHSIKYPVFYKRSARELIAEVIEGSWCYGDNYPPVQAGEVKISIYHSLYSKWVYSPLENLEYEYEEDCGIFADARDSSFAWEDHAGGWAEAWPINFPYLVAQGYDDEGYSPQGVHFSGYDRSGYDRNGYNHEGFNREGYDRDGFNRWGWTYDGFNRLGFDEDGFDRFGYDQDGYNGAGYNASGYHRDTGTPYSPDGFDRHGYDSEGYDHRGYNREGYNRQGVNRRGWSASGIHRMTGTRYNPHGYDRDGFDRKGYDAEGYDREGYNRRGYNEDGYDRCGREEEGVPVDE